jgi:hypothetical protein
VPASPAALGAYLAARADTRAVATLARRLAAISRAHREAELHLDTRHPAIRDVLRGIRRARGSAQRRARPATTPTILAMIATCDGTLIGLRDRALLLMRDRAARSSVVVAAARCLPRSSSCSRG